ncbi:cold-shock protein, partial [Aromatoleum toluvorans]
PFLSVVKLVIVGALATYAYTDIYPRFAQHRGVVDLPGKSLNQATDTPTAPFRCDGRTHCQQMTSCAEATFFLKNCPGVKMDGNNDGVPCEQQWCTGLFGR